MARPKAESGTRTEPGRPIITLPITIFGLYPADYSIPVLKRILAIFRKKLVKDQIRNVLLQRLAHLEQNLSLLECHAVTQILGRDLPITRALIGQWPTIGREAVSEVRTEIKEEYKCEACLDTLPAGFFRRNKISPLCDHECRLCEGCLTMGLESAMKDEEIDWEMIPCPCCRAVIPPETIRRYASADLLSEYEEYRVCFHLQSLKNFCLCSRPGCRSGQFHQGGLRAPRMICIKCNFETCFKHKVPWHEGDDPDDHNAATCRHYGDLGVSANRDKLKQNRASTSMIRRITKACPKCQIRILKNGGCDHMYCTQCKTNFRWTRAKRDLK
ncbi:hypothetical protein BDZ45DRAFT_737027 [Acephala macrosclerotiorum]|nr:hypothetical protein BDZ45DRAFT_737027 [Acephala macrosclerotiorum]